MRKLKIQSRQREHEYIAIDFDEELLKDFGPILPRNNFTEEDFAFLIDQADSIICLLDEHPQEQAGAYVLKFQLLAYQYKLAPKLLEKALALCPDMPQALIRMGVFFYKKDHDKAKMLEYINKVIETSPSFADAWLLRAYLAQDGKEQILSDCAEYSRLKPGSSLGYEKCGGYLSSLLPHNPDIVPDDAVKQDLETAINNYNEVIMSDSALRRAPSDSLKSSSFLKYSTPLFI